MSKVRPETQSAEQILAAKVAEAEKKAAELSVAMNTKVHPLVFKTVDSEDVVVGYFKEPIRAMKLRIMDSINTGAYTASSSVFDAYVLRNESDPRIFSENPADDKYYIGAVQEMYNVVTMAINQVKKK